MIWTCPCGCRVDDPSNGASGMTCAECMAKGGAPVAVAPSGLDLDALEAKACAATPGPWEAIASGGNGLAFLRAKWRPRQVEVTNDRAMSMADATFIAAASPDVILSLVARLRAAEALIDTIAHRCARFVKGPAPMRGMVRCNSFAVGVDANDCHVCDDHAGTARPADDDAYATALRAWLALRGTP